MTYKVYADNELRFTPIATLYFSRASVQALRRRRWRWVAVAVALLLLLLVLHWIARRRRLLVDLLRRIAVSTAAAGIDGWWHWRRRPALVRMLRRTKSSIASIGVLI